MSKMIGYWNVLLEVFILFIPWPSASFSSIFTPEVGSHQSFPSCVDRIQRGWGLVTFVKLLFFPLGVCYFCVSHHLVHHIHLHWHILGNKTLYCKLEVRPGLCHPLDNGGVQVENGQGHLLGLNGHLPGVGVPGAGVMAQGCPLYPL